MVMRRLLLCACILAGTAKPALPFIAYTELTPKNIAMLPFEFTITKEKYGGFLWLGQKQRLVVVVRPKEAELSQIRDLVGARLYHCPRPPEEGNDFEFRGDRPIEKDGALVYRFAVAEDSLSARCFYFWCLERKMPSGDFYWFTLDSPLVSGEKKPQSGGR
jgi:hypothetical protein